MKLGKFDVTAWTYRGEKMVGLHTIARRACAFPLLFSGKAMIFAAALVGWGLDEARLRWKQLP